MSTNGQAGQQDIFMAYKQAAERFHNACRVFRDAEQERSQSEKQLHELTQQLGQVIQEVLNDPTIPAPPAPNMQLKQRPDIPVNPNVGLGGSFVR